MSPGWQPGGPPSSWRPSWSSDRGLTSAFRLLVLTFPDGSQRAFPHSVWDQCPPFVLSTRPTLCPHTFQGLDAGFLVEAFRVLSLRAACPKPQHPGPFPLRANRPTACWGLPVHVGAAAWPPSSRGVGQWPVARAACVPPVGTRAETERSWGSCCGLSVV